MGKAIGAVLFVIALAFLVTIGLQLAGVEVYRFLGVKWADARQEVWQEGQPHITGTVSDIRGLQNDYYNAAGDAHKKAIAAQIIDKADSIGDDDLPADLREFVNGLRAERNGAPAEQP